MKIKKLLAGLLAGALTVTSVAVGTAFAADESTVEREPLHVTNGEEKIAWEADLTDVTEEMRKNTAKVSATIESATNGNGTIGAKVYDESGKDDWSSAEAMQLSTTGEVKWEWEIAHGFKDGLQVQFWWAENETKTATISINKVELLDKEGKVLYIFQGAEKKPEETTKPDDPTVPVEREPLHVTNGEEKIAWEADLTDVTEEMRKNTAKVSATIESTTNGNGTIGANVYDESGKDDWSSAEAMQLSTTGEVKWEWEIAHGFKDGLQVQFWWAENETETATISINKVELLDKEDKVLYTFQGAEKKPDEPVTPDEPTVPVEREPLYVTNGKDKIAWEADLTDVSEEIRKNTAKVVATIETTSEGNGIIGANVYDASGAADWATADAMQLSATGETKWEWAIANGFQDGLQVQFWWVSDESATVSIIKVELVGKDGNVLYTFQGAEKKPNEPVTPDEPTSVPATVKVYTQGNDAGGWAWTDSGDTTVVEVSPASEAVELKWTVAMADGVDSADKFGAAGIQIAFNDSKLAYADKKINVEITDITLGDEKIADIKGEYTVVKNWDSSNTEVMLPLDFITFAAKDKAFSCKIKITGSLAEEKPDDGEVVEANATVKVYTQGNDAGGWAWTDSGDTTTVTVTPESAAIELKWNIAVAEGVDDVSKFGAAGVQIAFDDPECNFVNQKVNVEITNIVLSDEVVAPLEDIADIKNEYTISANWNNTGSEIMISLPFITYEDIGKDLTCNIKITGALKKSPEKPEEPTNPEEPDDPFGGFGNDVVVDNKGNGAAAPAATTTAPVTAEDTSTNTTPPQNVPVDNNPTTNPPASGNTPEPAGSEEAAPVNTGNAGNTNSSNPDKNLPTGVALAFIPVIAAAAGVIVSKKRK